MLIYQLFSSWGIWARSILFHIILSHGLHLSISISLRAIASIDAKFFPFCTSKTYFFYFTLLFLQNTHISLSIIHLYSNKIFIFLPFFIIFFTYFLHCLSLPLKPNHHHHHYPLGEPLKIKPTQDQKTIQDQTNPRSETHLGQNPLNLKAKSSPTQPETHWSNTKKSVS